MNIPIVDYSIWIVGWIVLRPWIYKANYKCLRKRFCQGNEQLALCCLFHTAFFQRIIWQFYAHKSDFTVCSDYNSPFASMLIDQNLWDRRYVLYYKSTIRYKDTYDFTFALTYSLAATSNGFTWVQNYRKLKIFLKQDAMFLKLFSLFCS